MAATDVLSNVGVDLSGATSLSFFGIFQGFVIFILAAILIGIATYIYINKKTYNRKIDIFEEVNGQAIPTGTDVAMEITLPFTSVRAFYLKNRKIFLPRGSIQTGKDHFWYFIRDDGEWVNIGLSNLNSEMKKLNIKYDHTDMRMANASLKKLIEKNYKKTNWLKEYAPYIGFAIIIIMLGIAGYLVIGESAKATAGVAQTAEKLADIAESVNQMVKNVDSLTSNSGVRPVG